MTYISTITQKDKDLLFKDLCARLPYRVKCVFHTSKGDVPSTILKINIENEEIIHRVDGDHVAYLQYINNVKPYLRPMSSITEEEKLELENLNMNPFSGDIIDWLYSHHIDFRGFIEKDLALEATEGMYNIKEK